MRTQPCEASWPIDEYSLGSIPWMPTPPSNDVTRALSGPPGHAAEAFRVRLHRRVLRRAIDRGASPLGHRPDGAVRVAHDRRDVALDAAAEQAPRGPRDDRALATRIDRLSHHVGHIHMH